MRGGVATINNGDIRLGGGGKSLVGRVFSGDNMVLNLGNSSSGRSSSWHNVPVSAQPSSSQRDDSPLPGDECSDEDDDHCADQNTREGGTRRHRAPYGNTFKRPPDKATCDALEKGKGSIVGNRFGGSVTFGGQ